MAIIQITKIQVRRGDEVELTPAGLDTGEIGFATDTDRLFIGTHPNSTLKSRAIPPYDNLEVLTEASVETFARLYDRMHRTTGPVGLSEGDLERHPYLEATLAPTVAWAPVLITRTNPATGILDVGITEELTLSETDSVGASINYFIFDGNALIRTGAMTISHDGDETLDEGSLIDDSTSRYEIAGGSTPVTVDDLFLTGVRFRVYRVSDAPGTYRIRLEYQNTYGSPLVFQARAMVAARLVNSSAPDVTPPIITSPANRSIPENQSLTHILTANESVTWAKIGGADATLFTLTNNVLTLAAQNFEIPVDSNLDNIYSVQVRATDPSGNASTQTINVTITDVNETIDTTPPTITSAGAANIAENNAFSMNLTANETVTWTITGGGDASLFTLTGSVLSMTAKNYEVPVDANGDNIYVVQITATDTAGNFTNKVVSVTVTDVFEDVTAPVITSSNNLTVLENTLFTHNLTANETVTWTKTGGDDQSFFNLTGSTLSMAAKNYEGPTDQDADNVYVVQITATDTSGNFSSQTISVTILDIDEIAPTITSASVINLAENVALSHPLTANEAVTWTKTGGADQTFFTITGSTLHMTARNYEAPADSDNDNVYIVQVTATDGNNNSTNQIISVTITDVDEVPPTITSTPTPTVAENSAFSLTLTANETVTWTKTGGLDQALFTLTGNTLTMSAKDFEAPLDSNGDNIYVVQVTATDTAGNATNQTVSVTVTNVDDTAPVINTSATHTITENALFSITLSANETVTWTKSGGADQALFTLTGSTLTMAAKNFEAPVDANGDNVYVVQVTATDTANNTTNKILSVTVTDVDEIAPTITSTSSPSINENTAFSLTLTANETVTWTKTGGADQALFVLSGASLSMAAKDFETPLDANADNVYVVQVTATDLAGNSTNQTISLTIVNIDDTAPTITSSGTLSVAENSAFTHTLTANETVTWSKTGGSDQAAFVLSGATLTMTAKDFEAPVDSNADNVYVVQITATDTAGNMTNQTISVTVTDVAEGDVTPPVITSSATLTVAENIPFSHSLTANETVTWTKIGGADQALFTLSGNTLTMTAKDFENPADANADNVYVVQIRAIDLASNFVDQTITVTITDVLDSAMADFSQGSNSGYVSVIL